MKPIASLRHIRNPYTRRMLSNVIGKDPLNVLASTPARLRRLVGRLNEKQLRTPLAKGKWSIIQIVTHLADVEVVLAFRIRIALAQSGSPLQAMDQDRWASGLHYDKANLKRKLDLFAAVRGDHIRLFRSLKTDEWKRYGMHQERGKETVEHIVRLYAGHDINHLKQIEMIRKSARNIKL